MCDMRVLALMVRDAWVVIGVPGRVLALIAGIVVCVALVHVVAWVL